MNESTRAEYEARVAATVYASWTRAGYGGVGRFPYSIAADIVDALSPELARAELVPAWLVLNVVADTVKDRQWGDYDPSSGGTAEQWAAAKEGDTEAFRDELADVLLVMEERGWIALDWDAEPPEPVLIRAETVLQSGAERGEKGRDE